MACLGDHPHCFKQIAACVRNGRHPRGIESTAVLQLVLCVEAEEIGRALSIVSAREVSDRSLFGSGENLLVFANILDGPDMRTDNGVNKPFGRQC